MNYLAAQYEAQLRAGYPITLVYPSGLTIKIAGYTKPLDGPLPGQRANLPHAHLCRGCGQPTHTATLHTHRAETGRDRKGYMRHVTRTEWVPLCPECASEEYPT